MRCSAWANALNFLLLFDFVYDCAGCMRKRQRLASLLLSRPNIVCHRGAEADAKEDKMVTQLTQKACEQ